MCFPPKEAHDFSRVYFTDGEFTFDLLDTDGKTISTASNDANGDIVFGKIEYSADDIGKVYRYSMKEEQGDNPNISYDGRTVSVVVEIADKRDGTLTTSVTYDGKPDTVSFHNTYTPPATIGGKIAEVAGGVKSELVQTGVDISPYTALIAIGFGLTAIRLYIDRKRK